MDQDILPSTVHALVTKERKLRDAILDAVQDGVIAIDDAGCITVFNHTAEVLTGISRHDALGAAAATLIPNSRLHHVLGTGQSELRQVQSLSARQILTDRFPVCTHTGEVIGAFAVFRDETDIRALTSEVSNLKEVQMLLHAIINSTQDAISVVDAKGNGILINPAYTRLTGMTDIDVIGKPADVDIAEGDSMHFRVLRTHEPVRNAKMKVGPRRRDVIVNVAPLVVDGQIKGSVGVIHDISEMRQLTEELAQAHQRIRRLEAKYTFSDIVGHSPVMMAAVEAATRAAATPATVLLRGESGCGKELFAHAIHHASDRRYQDLVRVNCAAIAESLLESELFGYEEGAFSGARKGGKKGLFEEANHGTIFLDEVAELSRSTQAKLLRVLQEKEIVRVGGTRAIAIDVRVIAATHANLEEAIAEGRFREDLYYRLNVVPIFIPPLRYRKEDIELLATMLMRKFNHEYGRHVTRLSAEALVKLQAYHWPGNVRELENVVGRAMIGISYQEAEIGAQLIDLPSNPAQTVVHDTTGPSEPTGSLAAVVEAAECAAIAAALARTDSNKTEAARLLGISIRSLYYKMERYQLDAMRNK
ncbi:MAG: sigma 54-interacting transcriptional regulator [Firmicutes bacterium]|nr:sigma 54-interacting transcriptional regulator [Bacillota bacterium]